MKVTGFQLREAIKRWRHRRDTLYKAFPETIWAFEGDQKNAPEQAMLAYQEADRAVAILEAAQDIYNNKVRVDWDGGHTLAEAIKMVGGFGRAEKMWRDAVVDKPDPYAYSRSRSPRERSKDSEMAKRQISTDAALNLADGVSRRGAALRAMIALANTQLIDIDVASTLFA